MNRVDSINRGMSDLQAARLGRYPVARRPGQRGGMGDPGRPRRAPTGWSRITAGTTSSSRICRRAFRARASFPAQPLQFDVRGSDGELAGQGRRQGNPVEPTPFITNPAGFTIHSAIHMAREDAHAVMHLHTPAGQAVSAHAEGLLPLTQTAMLVRGDLAFHDYEGIAVDLDERERLVADLGEQERDDPAQSRHARGRQERRRMLRPPLFLERACQAQIMALSAGDRINNPPQARPKSPRSRGGRDRAGRQPARLAGAEAQSLSPRSELRELSWRGKPRRSATIARSPRRGCRISCSNISTAARTTK